MWRIDNIPFDFFSIFFSTELQVTAGDKSAPINFATCFPSACNASQVEQLFRNLINSTDLDVPVNVNLDEAQCQTKESVNPELTDGALMTM